MEVTRSFGGGEHPSCRFIPTLRSSKDVTPAHLVATQPSDTPDVVFQRRRKLLQLQKSKWPTKQEALRARFILAIAADYVPEVTESAPQEERKEAEEEEGTKEGRISLTRYRQLCKDVPERCKPFFSLATFHRLPKDGRGRIGAKELDYAFSQTQTLMHVRYDMAELDSEGLGYLEQEFEQWVINMIPKMLALDDLELKYRPFYICGVVRRFAFFLCNDFLELRDYEIIADQSQLNPFSLNYTKRIYAEYLHVDQSHTGLLTLDEMRQFREGTLSELFLQRLFSMTPTYGDNCLDYAGYLTLITVLENANRPQAITWLFRLVDLEGRGAITRHIMAMWIKEVVTRVAYGKDMKINDVVTEIFDMAGPKCLDYITQDDLIRSGHGGTILLLMFDSGAFFEYDNREG